MVKTKTTKEEVLDALKKAAGGKLKVASSMSARSRWSR
jgi:hypothetical protein